MDAREQRREISRRWYANNRDVHKARVKRAAQKNPNAAFDRHLRRTYGISFAQYTEILERQGGGCALCGKETGRREDAPCS